MSFNNTYFPEANCSIQFEEVVQKVIDQVNTYTTNSFFDDQAILKEIKGLTTLNDKQFFSKSNQFTLSNNLSGGNEKFIIRFTGEGIVFKILFEKNNDCKDGFVALEFTPENHSLLKALEKTVVGLLVAKQQTAAPIVKKVISTEQQETAAAAVKEESPVNFDEPCKCNSITPISSGNLAMQIADFTTDFVAYYSYKNMDELTIFTCKKCSTNWLIDTRFTDKSTYLNTAKIISTEKLQEIKKRGGKSLDNLIELSGVQAVVDSFDPLLVHDKSKNVGEKLNLSAQNEPENRGRELNNSENRDAQGGGSRCNCSTAPTMSSGAYPMFIQDFTTNYICHFQHSSSDIFGIFTCMQCATILVIDARFTDRPPFSNSAKKISAEKLEKVMKQGIKQLEKMIANNGVGSVANLMY